MSIQEVMEKIIGLNIDDAEFIAADSGFIVRKVKEDGKGLFIKDDYRVRRINVEVINGKVTNVQGIG